MPDSTNDSFKITAEQFQKILKKQSMKQRKRASKKKRSPSENAKNVRPTSWEGETDGEKDPGSGASDGAPAERNRGYIESVRRGKPDFNSCSIS